MRKYPPVSRWSCAHCGAEGWSSDGRMPPHDNPHGTSCRKSGQLSENAIRRKLNTAIAVAAVSLMLAGCADTFQLDTQSPAEQQQQIAYCVANGHTMYYRLADKWKRTGYILCPGGRYDMYDAAGLVKWGPTRSAY